MLPLGVGCHGITGGLDQQAGWGTQPSLAAGAEGNLRCWALVGEGGDQPWLQQQGAVCGIAKVGWAASLPVQCWHAVLPAAAGPAPAAHAAAHQWRHSPACSQAQTAATPKACSQSILARGIVHAGGSHWHLQHTGHLWRRMQCQCVCSQAVHACSCKSGCLAGPSM